MLIAQRPVLTEEVVSEHRSRFVIEPLEPGFGYTLGNSLRRTLLSSIPGAAVTSIRVNGALHEFTTIEGVKEDLTEVVLNIKNLVLSSENDEPAVACGTGPGRRSRQHDTPLHHATGFATAWRGQAKPETHDPTHQRHPTIDTRRLR